MDEPTVAEQCRQLIDKHQYKAAMALLDEQTGAFTNELEYHLLKSEAYYYLDKGEQALAAAQKALDLDPKNAIATWCRGNAYFRLKKYTEAITDYRATIDMAPDFAKLYNDLGNVYYAQKDYAAAIVQYGLAISKDPDDALAYYNLGNVYADQKNYAEAIAQYELAILKAPDNAATYIGLGNVYATQNNYVAAIAQYELAISKAPDVAVPYYNLGNVYATQNNYIAAIAQYELAILKAPDYAAAYISLGNVYYAQENYAQTIKLYRQAISKAPNYAAAYYNLGNVYVTQKDYVAAIEQYEQAILKNPDYAAAYNNLGAVYSAQQDYDQAIAHYTQALEKNHQNVLYFRNLGDAYKAIKAYDTAIAHYDKALALEPQNYGARLGRNEALALQGEYQAIEATTDNKEKSSVPEFIKELIEEKLQTETEETKKQVMILGTEVAETVGAIRKIAFSERKDPVAHYTKLLVANIIVKEAVEKSKLRYHNVAYMNDPEEGKVLLQILQDVDSEGFGKIAACFEAGKKREDNNVYLGSFVPLSQQDELVMWRTYGKENNVEATGCSVVIASGFFDGENKHLQKDFGSKDNTGNMAASPNILEKEALYEVMYYNKKQGNEGNRIIGPKAVEIEKGLKELTKALHDLVDLKKGYEVESDLSSVVNRVVFRTLSEIRYLFKSADYSYENELRVIQYVDGESDRVQIDETGSLPHRLYIESCQSIKPSLQKIILGPKVANPDQWLYLEVKMKKEGYKLELEKSVVHFQ